MTCLCRRIRPSDPTLPAVPTRPRYHPSPCPKPPTSSWSFLSLGVGEGERSQVFIEVEDFSSRVVVNLLGVPIPLWARRTGLSYRSLVWFGPSWVAGEEVLRTGIEGKGGERDAGHRSGSRRSSTETTRDSSSNECRHGTYMGPGARVGSSKVRGMKMSCKRIRQGDGPCDKVRTMEEQ